MSASSKLKKQIKVELAQLDGLMDRHPQLLAKRPDELLTAIEIDAVAALLHSFYTGVENLFKRIGVALDAGPPKGDNWHIALLDSMAHATAERRPVISEELRMSLRRFLEFRHVFRHAYSFDLQWSKMAPLVGDCLATFAKLKDEIESFVQAPDQ